MQTEMSGYATVYVCISHVIFIINTILWEIFKDNKFHCFHGFYSCLETQYYYIRYRFNASSHSRLSALVSTSTSELHPASECEHEHYHACEETDSIE